MIEVFQVIKECRCQQWRTGHRAPQDAQYSASLSGLMVNTKSVLRLSVLSLSKEETKLFAEIEEMMKMEKSVGHFRRLSEDNEG